VLLSLKRFYGLLILAWLSLLVAFSGCHSNGLISLNAADQKPTVIGEHSPGLAPALVKLPEALELMAVNGKKLPLIWQSRSEFAFPPGTHRLRVRYVYVWDVGSEDHEIVRSEMRDIRVSLKSGVRYHFGDGPEYQTPEQAKQELPNEVVQLFRSSNAISIARDNTLPVEFQADDGQENYAQRQVQIEVPKHKESLLDAMKLLWQQLSEQEREQFAEFIQEYPLSQPSSQ